MSHVLINKARIGARNRRVGGSLLSVVFGGGGCGGGCGAGFGFYSKDYNVCCLGINQRPQTEDVFPRISNEAPKPGTISLFKDRIWIPLRASRLLSNEKYNLPGFVSHPPPRRSFTTSMWVCICVSGSCVPLETRDSSFVPPLFTSKRTQLFANSNRTVDEQNSNT